MFPNDNEMIIIRIKVVITLGGRRQKDKMEEFYLENVSYCQCLIITLKRFINIYYIILNK